MSGRPHDGRYPLQIRKMNEPNNMKKYGLYRLLPYQCGQEIYIY